MNGHRPSLCWRAALMLVVLTVVSLVGACASPSVDQAAERSDLGRAEDVAGVSSDADSYIGNAASGSASDVEPVVSIGDWGHGGEMLAEFPPLSPSEQFRLGEGRFGDGHGAASIYTFVLFGGGHRGQENRPWRRAELELLRLIETYLVGQGEAPTGSRHQFLVPVYAGLDSLPLSEQSAPELATNPRRDLVQQLGVWGQSELAARVQTVAGPFLVSQTGADWRHRQSEDGLLVADLSAIGPEYLYPLVDAYDRPVSAGAAGSAATLAAIYQRLADMGSTSEHLAPGQWLFLVKPAGLSSN